MADMRIRGVALPWFESFFVGSCQLVEKILLMTGISAILPALFFSNQGVPQGSMLDSTLFLLFLNYLPVWLNSKCLFYMQMTRLLLFPRLKERIWQVQCFLKGNELLSWMKKMLFILIISKSSLVKFAFGKKTTQLRILS